MAKHFFFAVVMKSVMPDSSPPRIIPTATSRSYDAASGTPMHRIGQSSALLPTVYRIVVSSAWFQGAVPNLQHRVVARLLKAPMAVATRWVSYHQVEYEPTRAPKSKEVRFLLLFLVACRRLGLPGRPL